MISPIPSLKAPTYCSFNCLFSISPLVYNKIFTTSTIHPGIFLGRALWADRVSPRMSIIASRDQFKPTRIEENLALNYNFSYFYSIVERADRIARELDASSKQENGTDSPFQLSCTNPISWIFFNTVDNCNDIKTIETCFSAMMIVNAVGAILIFSGSIIGCMGTCCAKESVSHASKRPVTPSATLFKEW